MTTATASHEAALAIQPAAKNLRRQVCEFIAKQGANGATDEEIQLGLGMNPSTERPRRGEVWAYGLITDAIGERRQSASGRACVVWHVTKRGMEAVGMEGWCAP